MVPPPGVVTADVDVEGVVAVGDQEFRRLDTFVQVAALFDEVLARQRADPPVLHHALGAVPEGDDEIFAAAGLDLLDDLFGKAEPVFEAAAVLVGPLVEDGDGELVEQIPFVDGVDLDAVETGPFGVVSAEAEGLDNLVDFVDGQRPAGLIQPAVGDGRRGDGGILAEVGGDGDPAETGGHLEEDFRAVGVDPFGHLPGGAGKVDRVPGGGRTVGHPVFLDLVVDKGDAGDNQPGSAFGPLGVVVDAPLVKPAVGVAEAQRPHRRHRKTVFQGDIAD